MLIGVFGGGFALYKFYRQDVPTLEPRAVTNSSLQVGKFNDSQCKADFWVNLENNGVAPFDVKETRLRAWIFDWKVPDPSAAASYFRSIESSPPNFDSANEKSGFEKDEIPFVRHYAVGAKFSWTFTLFLRRVSHSYFYCRADFKRDPKSKTSDWFSASWKPSCNDEPSPSPNSSPSPTPSVQ
jgi:hypothetical protein